VENINLIKAVEHKIKDIRTRSLDLSFNELLDMYENEELIISPEYQRLFRWSEGSQSRFIESLVLEMPVPPIFVIELEEGVYELIDGLQRISSYLHFRGKHPDKEESLTLIDCDIVPELNGVKYSNLPKPLEIKLKRNFIRVEVLRKESDHRLRYYMFKRLNTGGETLSEQEIRNSTIRLLNNQFNDFIIKLSGNPEFKNCIESVNDEKIEQKYDQELVLRYFAFKNYRDEYVHDVRDFLTEYMENVSDTENVDVTFDYELEEKQFNKTFSILNNSLGSKIFSGVNKQGRFVSRFYIYHYEAFCIGILPFLEKLNETDETQMTELGNLFTEIKQNETFKTITTGGGKNYYRPLNERISFVENKLRENYE
jgi:hypothetical protein